MTIIFDGTQGITTPTETANNSVTTPVVKSGSALTLQTNGSTTAVTIDTSQNVGIGTTSPSAFGAGYTSLCVNASTAPIVDLFVGGTRSASFNGTSTYSQVSTVTNTPLLIGTNGTERMRVLTTGNILCLSGGSTSATGTGIAFPATQSASNDANTLDDYEEGTWSPTIIGTTTAGTVSYNSRQGRYTKIGNIVTISAWVDWTSGTGSGLLRISGLPFTGSTNQYQAIGLGGVAALATGGSGKIPFLRLPTGESSIQVKTMFWDGSSFSDDDVTYDGSAVITLTGTYIIA